MYHCKFRALTADGNPVFFTVQDVPVLIEPTKLILARRPNSPILVAESMCRVMDHEPLAEGDVVIRAERPYTVKYNAGFYFHGKCDGINTPSNVEEPYRIVSLGTKGTAPVRFKYHGRVFDLMHIRGCNEKGEALVSGFRVPVNPNEIQVSTGRFVFGTELFFGDEWDGKETTMLRGRIVKKDAIAPLGLFANGGNAFGPY